MLKFLLVIITIIAVIVITICIIAIDSPVFCVSQCLILLPLEVVAQVAILMAVTQWCWWQ